MAHTSLRGDAVRVLAGRVAIITGAGGGIGREHALAFARAGAAVVVNDIGVDLDGSGGSPGPARQVVDEITAQGGRAVTSTDSVASYEGAGRIVERAVSAFGTVDILVNNASVFRDGPFLSMTPDDFAADLAVHLVGTFNTCHHALPHMVDRGWGRIINTTSSGWHSASGLAGYAAAKAGVLGLSMDVAAEFWRRGVTVNVIAPVARTEHRVVQGKEWIAKLTAAGLADDVFASIAAGSDGGRSSPERPDHIPPLAVWLASDAGGSVSGRVFEVMDNDIGVFAHPRVTARVAKEGDAVWSQEELTGALTELLAADGPRAPHVPVRPADPPV